MPIKSMRLCGMRLRFREPFGKATQYLMSPKKTANPIWRRNVLAWCCYDWANSGYTTLMITVFAVYMQRTVFSTETSGATGAVVWAWSVAISMLIGALLSPIIGALADAQAGKRLGLGISAMCGGAACMLMAMIPPENTWLVTSCLIVANLSLELSLTLYNGFLPEVADEQEINRVSAAGMAWGYFGGGLALLFAMLVLSFGPRFGFDNPSVLLRGCIFATGAWWCLFTIPAIVVLRDRPRPILPRSFLENGSRAFADVVETIKGLRYHRTLAFFLIAFLFYNDGVQTVISQSSTFAIQELQFTDLELVAVILMVQFIATPGAILIGWISDRWGRKHTLMICLLVWVILLTSASFVQSKAAYWAMSVGVALVLGGTQAVSRAIMGTLTPTGQESRYFGFFNFSGKATSFMGTFFFGLVIATTGSSRTAIVGLLIFFVIGLATVARLDFRNDQAP
jgi:MFS transporter, UMF1 family